MNKNNRRKKIFANKMHKEILSIVLLAAFLPTIIIAISLYYLIFGVTSAQIGIPEAIAYNIIPAARRVVTISLVATPVVILAILILAYKITHKIIGPFNRIVKELDESIEGKKHGPIIVRTGDKFMPLVARINRLLGKLKQQSSNP